MSQPVVETAAPTASGWRFKFGIFIFIFAFSLWLLVPLAASTGASSARVAAITGAIFVANKVLLLTCIAVMGKPGFQQLKSLVFGYAKGLAPSGPVGPVRHVVGLVMFCLPLVSAMLEPYVDNIWPGLRKSLATPGAGRSHADRELLRARRRFLEQGPRPLRPHGHPDGRPRLG